MKKQIIIGTITVLAVGIGVAAMTVYASKPKEYFAEAAKYESISEKIDVTGTIKGEKSKTYYANVTAPVSEYEINVGDSVKGDQVVLIYDTSDLQKALDQALLTAESSENNMNGQIAASNKKAALYNQAVEDSNIYMNLYAIVRASNDSIDQHQYQNNWDTSIIGQGIKVNIAEKEKSIASRTQEMNDRINELANTPYGTQQAIDLQNRIDALESEIYGLKTDIASLNVDLAALPPTSLPPEDYAKEVVNGNWMSDIMRNWTQSTTVKNTYEAQILNSYQKDQLQNSYDLTELSVVNAEENIAKAIIGVAVDYDGVVTESFVKSGSVVSKGTPLFTIESSNEIKAEVGVSKYDIGKIELGQKALITIAGREYDGTVEEIKRLATATDSDKAKVMVSVHITNPDEYAYLGLEADVIIYSNEKDGAIVIPSQGCYSDDDGDYCYVIRDSIIEKQYIVTGVQSDDYVEVLEGIRVGDTVIKDAITDKAVGAKAVAK